MSHFEREPHLAEWDTNHFGVKIAGFGPQETVDVAVALAWAQSHGIQMIMARCDTLNAPAIHALQNDGFLLMDTFVRYYFDFSKKEIPKDTGAISIRPFHPDDTPAIVRVASTSFKGYVSHFYNDPKLAQEKCDSLYVQWAMNSCHEKHLADQVLVADDEGEILGFATLKGLTEDTAEGILFGVDFRAQGRGIYRSFMIHGMRWCLDKGFHRMEVDSQVDNYAVQCVWQRLGFEIYTSGHTFHLWLKD